MATQAENLRMIMRAIMTDVRRYHASKNKDQQHQRAEELKQSLRLFISWLDDDVDLTIPTDEPVDWLDLE